MDENSTPEILSASISALRLQSGLTQAALAEQLGITFQAVSKWENGQSAPDITLLPQLADIFGVQIDELFGRAPAQPAAPADVDKAARYVVDTVPWDDDGELRGVVYKGQTLLEKANRITRKFVFVYKGDAVNVSAMCGLECGNIAGNASAGTSISAGNIDGSANAGTGIVAQNIGNNVKAGTHVNAADITGNVNAGTHVMAHDITGDVRAGTHISGKRIIR